MNLESQIDLLRTAISHTFDFLDGDDMYTKEDIVKNLKWALKETDSEKITDL